ncbi:MAG: transglutaminase domain-containing protein, partial [Desulfobacterales bacterium]|nr:transglutaminase domain-containing protein [Desulfobacterales bacterium]
AARLDHSPLKIYTFVRNVIDFELYAGSRKGSLETLRSRAGNDKDIASLLISLLRHSGFASRYVTGMVELPIEATCKWLGVDDPGAAASLLASAGLEGALIVDNNQPSAIRFRHTWVLAHVPFGNYRGRSSDQTGKVFLPLDASIKQYAITPGMDILDEMGFSTEDFYHEYLSTFHESTPMELFVGRIKDHLAVNHPDLEYGDILRTRSIGPENLPYLAASLPFRTLRIEREYAEIPVDKRYRIRFMLYHGLTTFIDYTANLPEIIGRGLTISYEPAE